MISLKEKYKDYFNIGAAVNNTVIKTHHDILVKHFNCITCENEMKYSSVCNDKGEYDFTRSDNIVTFARENNLLLRGHTFTWHNQTPEWVFQNTDKENLLERLKNHITILGQRYQSDIFCWDVVNEAIEDKNDMVLRETGWSRIIGEDYMEKIFSMTKEILPETLLFYNDYNETNPIKREKIFHIIKDMQDKGIPVDGIGMQCHSSLYHPSTDELKSSIELYAKLGLRIHITEMDVSLFAFDDTTSINQPSDKLLSKQADVYESFFKVFREYKDIIDCVTLWGVADDCTWLDNFPVKNRKNWPLLFDENHMPKEAFHRIINL